MQISKVVGFMGKNGKIVAKTAAWSKCSKPQVAEFKGLKFAKEAFDSLELSGLQPKTIPMQGIIRNPEYAGIIDDMVRQRGMMTNSVMPEFSADAFCASIKDSYSGGNRRIRNNIMNSRGKANGFVPTVDDVMADEFISQGRLPRNATLYRGASPYDFGLCAMDSKDFIKRFYKKGKIFRIPIYPETSLDKKVAENLAKDRILFKINAGKDTPAIYMEELRTPTTHLNGNEEEVMLARDLLYKFKNHYRTPDFDIIEVDVVKKAPFWKKVHEFWKEVPAEYWKQDRAVL